MQNCIHTSANSYDPTRIGMVCGSQEWRGEHSEGRLKRLSHYSVQQKLIQPSKSTLIKISKKKKLHRKQNCDYQKG